MVAVSLMGVQAFQPSASLCHAFPSYRTLASRLRNLGVRFLGPGLPIPIVTGTLQVQANSTVVAFTIVIRGGTQVSTQNVITRVVQLKPQSLQVLHYSSGVITIHRVNHSRVGRAVVVTSHQHVGAV